MCQKRCTNRIVPLGADWTKTKRVDAKKPQSLFGPIEPFPWQCDRVDAKKPQSLFGPIGPCLWQCDTGQTGLGH